MRLIEHPLVLPGVDPATIRVLSIDDQEMNLRVHRRLLEVVVGITDVAITQDPFAGLELVFGERRPDLAIVNGLMPGMDGPTLIAELRRREAELGLPHLAVAISSGAGAAHEAGLAAGADATLEIPVDAAELVGLLLRFVARPPQPPGLTADPDWTDASDAAAALDVWCAAWAAHAGRAGSLQEERARILEEALAHAVRIRVLAGLRRAQATGLLRPAAAAWLLWRDHPDDLREWVRVVFGALIERGRLTETIGPSQATATAALRHAAALEAALRFGIGGRERLRALAVAAAADGFLSPQEVFAIVGRDRDVALRLVDRFRSGW